MAENTEPTPANQVSLVRWAELKRAYVARLPRNRSDSIAPVTDADLASTEQKKSQD
ncbi:MULTISPECIES: hypothetical protein [Cryobacterium]|uniref:hypothetical protein n=1 Tax=Cryobacterium TaxID=69578 RepID=UPI00135A892D|nr:MULTISPECIES: hypothetical protein [Cryobacterium]